MSDFLTLAHERYSCRTFTDEPVSDSDLDAILEAGVCAPTAVDKQPWHAWMLASDDALARVRTCTRFHFDAPVVIALGALPEAAWTRKFDGRNFADVDASIVGTQMMLAIHDLGLGTTWVGHFDAPALKEAFPEMAAYDLVALFPVGHPAAGPGPMHAQRKPVEELVDRL